MAPSGCLHTTLRGRLQQERVLAATFGSSEVPAWDTILPTLTQAADCYRALLVSLMGLNGGGAPETNHSPPPLSTAAKQVTLVSPPTGRDHTVFLSCRTTRAICACTWVVGIHPPLHTNNALLLIHSPSLGEGNVQGTLSTPCKDTTETKRPSFFSSKQFNSFLSLTSLILLEFPSRLAKIQAGPLIVKFRLKKYLLMFLLKMFGNPN